MPSRELSPDRPITNYEEDALGRAPFARLLAAEALAAPEAAGFVIGLTGPWGTGKTSALHLIEQEIAGRATALWFNPWLFGGADQLVGLFFGEIAGQLTTGHGRRLKKIGDSMAEYGEVVAPAVAAAIGPVAAALALPNRLRQLREKSVRDRYKQLKEQLREARTKIVVFIDDFDRLTPAEVREVVRLVKLVADLPNVVYILAYDQPTVERALGDEAEPGRAYLDKIVQAPHPLPSISRVRLQTIALDDLTAAVGENKLHHFDQDQWSMIAGAVLPYITTIRAAKRYANVAPVALDLAGDEVAAHDVLGLTALRVFEPDVHDALPRVVPELTGERDTFDLRDTSKIRADEEAHLVNVLQLAAQARLATDLLRTLFPAAPLGYSPLSGGSRQARAAQRVATQSFSERIYKGRSTRTRSLLRISSGSSTRSTKHQSCVVC